MKYKTNKYLQVHYDYCPENKDVRYCEKCIKVREETDKNTDRAEETITKIRKLK